MKEVQKCSGEAICIKPARSTGSVGDIMILGIFVLAMMTVMFSFLDCVELIRTKDEVSQLSRKYILVAETYGYIPEDLQEALMSELEELGVTEGDISESTLTKAEFGKTVSVCIKGKIGDKYEITDKRSSTAKY